MTSLLVGFVVNAVVGLAIGVAASRYVWRRALKRERAHRMKRERAHRMRIGLFDRAGECWLDIDCDGLGLWYRYGGLDRGHNEWAELQQIGEFSLRARPVADR